MRLVGGRFRWWTIVAIVVLAFAAAVPAMAQTGPGGETEIVGTVRDAHGDDFADGHEVDQHYVLDTPSGRVRVVLPDGEALNPGQQARLRGHYNGAAFVVASHGVSAAGGGGSGAGTSSADSTAVAAVTGTKTVAVLLLNFSNDTSQPWTGSTVRGVVFDNSNSVNAYYQDSSDGQLGLAGDVYGWYTIPSDNSGCAWSSWGDQARTAATNAGVNLANYQYVVYAWPYTSTCAWSGLGYLPGTLSYINGAMTLRTVSHELGHNFGVHHASAESCTDAGVRVTLSASCSSSEYGDPFSVMGSASTRLHHNWHRAQLGFTDAGQTISTSGDYLLAPADSTGATRLLRIARSDGTYYQLEFRQPTGIFDNFAATDPAVNGVTIRVAPNPTTIVQSQLLDATPDTTTFADSPLAVGRTFADPFTGMQITTKSVSPSGATVTVAFVPDTTLPSTPTDLTATAKSTSSIALAWTASTDNVGVAGYRILRGGVQIGTTTSTSYADTGLSPATAYTYQVVAYDAAGNVSPAAQASATTFTPDTQAPSAPANLKASVAKSGVSFSWTASTDNVAVTGYQILRNGVVVKTVTGTTTTDKPRRGTYTYTVKAYDAAGNVSGASNTVTVTV
jgi:chitodextrinase